MIDVGSLIEEALVLAAGNEVVVRGALSDGDAAKVLCHSPEHADRLVAAAEREGWQASRVGPHTVDLTR